MSEYLFELPPKNLKEAARKFRQLHHPIWTENKAKLIGRYLYYFVLITKHGSYIDGFAGPQEPDNEEMWAAKLVLESRPRWLRHFYLCELSAEKVKMLESLRDSQPRKTKKEPRRTITICAGDFNATVGKMLAEHPVPDKEAAFCLLDQRAFECDWATVATLAAHKKAGNKIELFYFLPNAWLDRSVSGLKDKQGALAKWWGDTSWNQLLARRGIDRAKYACERFRSEFNYKHVYPFPIYERREGGKMMYFMIHASDHEEATPLMYRAYNKALGTRETAEQLEFLTSTPAP